MRHLLIATAALAAAGCATTTETMSDAPRHEGQPIVPPPLESATLYSAAPLTRIAFGSCYDPLKHDSAIWDAVRESEPDLFLALGDNVYPTEETGDPEFWELREAYAALAADEAFAALRAEVPVLATWDDHDYGLNDAGWGFAAKRESEALFEDVWAIPADDPRRARDGVYGAWMVGVDGRRTQIILLDTRFFRSDYAPTDDPNVVGKERYVPDPDPGKTMLGAAQWAWLAEELAKPADLRIIASSVQVLADGHGFEGWRMMPAERDRLAALIGETGANDVIFISGDRHFGGLYAYPMAEPYPLVEATSSSLNRPFPDDRQATHWENDWARVDDIVYAANFGFIEIDWDARVVSLQLRDGAGATQQRLDVRLDELTAR